MGVAIATITGVDMASIKNLGGVDFSGWEEAYSINFADYDSSGEMSDAGTISISGVTWTAGVTNGTVEIDSTGLILTAAAGSDMFSSGVAVPRLSADVSDLVPNLTTKDVICMQWIQTYDPGLPTNNFEAVGGQLWDGETGGGWKGMGIRALHNSNLKWAPLRGNNTEGNITDSDEYNSFEIVWYFMGQTAIISSAATGVTAMSQPLVIDTHRSYANYGSSNWTTTESNIAGTLTPSNTKAMFYAMEVTHNRTFKGIFKGFRIFRARVS